MKDIKSYIIGFLSCACLFLFMGQSKIKMNQRINKLEDRVRDLETKFVVHSMQLGNLKDEFENYEPFELSEDGKDSDSKYAISSTSSEGRVFVTIINTETGKIISKTEYQTDKGAEIERRNAMKELQNLQNIVKDLEKEFIK
jgi:TolA-binding protein